MKTLDQIIPQQSIFETLLVPNLQNKQITSRLFHSILCTNSTSAQQLKSKLSVFLDISNSNQTSKFGGLLIIKEHFIIHFLESDNQNINQYLDFLLLEKQSGELVQKVVILALNEEFPFRVFPFWGFDESSSLGATRFDVEKSENDTENSVWEVYEKFLLAGYSISDKLKAQGKFSGGLVKEAMNYVQLNQEETGLLANDHFPEIEEYLAIFKSQVDSKLDSQTVWPAEWYVSQLLEYQKLPYSEYNGIK